MCNETIALNRVLHSFFRFLTDLNILHVSLRDRKLYDSSPENSWFADVFQFLSFISSTDPNNRHCLMIPKIYIYWSTITDVPYDQIDRFFEHLISRKLVIIA